MSGTEQDGALEPVPAGGTHDRSRAGLGRAAAGGVMWEGVSYVLGKLLTLTTTVILARVLVPDDFGVVAMALIFITYAEVMTDLGVSQALVFLPPAPRRLEAALAVTITFSVGLVALGLVAAPWVGRLFGRADVVPLVRVLLLGLAVAAVGSIPDALLRKHLSFRRRLVATLSRSAVKGALAVVLALLGAGPWSLVLGYVGGEVVWAIAGWSLVDERPSWRLWRIGWRDLRPLLAYGAPAAGNALALSLVFNVDYLIVGERLGATALGYYTVAYRLPEMMILHALWVVSAVSFPVYSRLREDRSRLRRGYLTGMRLQVGYGMAGGAALAVLAPVLVPVVFGERWLPSVAPLQALAVYAVWASLSKSAMDLYKGIGRPGVAFTMSLLRLAVVAPALLIGVRFGIAGVAAAHALASLVLAVALQALAIRLIAIPVRSFVSAMVTPVVAGLAVATAAGAVMAWVPGPDVVRLVAGGAAALAAALLAVWSIDRPFVAEVRSLLRRGPLRPAARDVDADVGPVVVPSAAVSD